MRFRKVSIVKRNMADFRGEIAYHVDNPRRNKMGQQLVLENIPAKE